MGGFEIGPEDPRTADIVELLRRHLAFANEHSPPEDVHALDVDGLVDPAITFCSARRDGKLLAVGALKRLDDRHAELKSMHTAVAGPSPAWPGPCSTTCSGWPVRDGYGQVGLETGSMDTFAPARALYAVVGFTVCPPFGGYWESPNSTCMTLALDGAG